MAIACRVISCVFGGGLISLPLRERLSEGKWRGGVRLPLVELFF